MQLAQIQLLGAQLIIKVFKIISMQTLNIKTYFSSIDLELDKKIYQIAISLYLSSFYSIITLIRFIHLKQTLISLEILEKRYI